MGAILSSLFGAGEVAAAESTLEDSSESRVMSFHSTNRWQLHYNSLKDSDKLLVVDFAASWCGPCKFIEPAVKAIANKYPDVEFAKIDVDELPDVAKEFEVQAMPTFIFLKKGKVVDKVVGAKKDELEHKIAKCVSS
ncbi:thioredoxin H2-like [Chenopodium quinoa]|uniref:Thioredoxin domain-containing protein n=1 Tax=Chenopodium quinoa TaxID=63459 RepID=A0A803ML33_CHEQI|nr:thioredoxin H2-like [Chenopodium quinoa]